MVQEDKDNLVPIHLTKEFSMVKSAAAKPARSGMRISTEDYKGIALALRTAKQEPTRKTVSYHATLLMRKVVPESEVTDNRLKHIIEYMRAQDAAEAVKARAQIAGSVHGLKNGDTADLLIKSIIKTEVAGSELRIIHAIMDGTRKLLLSQEARFESRLRRQQSILVELCKTWDIPIPDLADGEILPQIEMDGRVVKPPRVLLYGLHTNQKQAIHEKVREWGLKDVATIDIGTTAEAVSTMRNGYDAVIVNRHHVGVDAVRDLSAHGLELRQAAGPSEVMKHLQSVLLGLQIEKKRSES